METAEKPSLTSVKAGLLVGCVAGAGLLAGSSAATATSGLWASQPVQAVTARTVRSLAGPPRLATAVTRSTSINVPPSGSIAFPGSHRPTPTLSSLRSPQVGKEWVLGLTACGLAGVLYFRRFVAEDSVMVMAASSGSNDDLTSALDPVEAETLPAADAVTAAEKKVGWLLRNVIGEFCFMAQFWLSIIAAAVGLFATQFVSSRTGAMVGLGATIFSLVASYLSVFWTLQCRQTGKLLLRQATAKNGRLPTKSEVVRQLWQGLLINAHGLLAAVVGIEANAGLLLAQSLAAGEPIAGQAYVRAVSSFDVFAQLAQTQALLALIIGVIAAIYALRVVTQPFSKRKPSVPSAAVA